MRDVLAEQIRAVALALRWPATAAAAGIALLTAANVLNHLYGVPGAAFEPELSMIPGTVGMLLPIGIWRRDERIGNGFFWTLPVDRHHHVLMKVCAGWVCLMASVTFALLWFLPLAAWTNGSILAVQEVRVLPDSLASRAATLSVADLAIAHWQPHPLLWLVPFTAASGMYLMASAFALGTRFPLRWLVGIVLGGLLVSVTGTMTKLEWLKLAPSHLFDTVYAGRYGIDALMTARTESLKTVTTLADGTTTSVWRALPSLAHWAWASLIWIGFGMTMLWAAAARHSDRRRPSHSYPSE